MNNNVLKYSVAIPVFAALFLVAVTAFPASQNPADAVTGGISGIIPASVMMDSEKLYLVHITTGDPTSDYERHAAMMGVQHAKAFQEAGKEVIIFLDVNSPVLADNQHAPQLKVGHDTLKAFIEDGGRVIACQHCIVNSGVEDLMTGIEVDSHPLMPRLQKILSDADVILDY